MPYLAVKDGTKIYYEEQGKGETILFLHGLNSSSLFIRDFINQFKDKYHCVYYDHRGHKLSEQSTIHMNIDTLANDMRELIEYLNLDNITVVGHSMGAGTIFRYVNKFVVIE